MARSKTVSELDYAGAEVAGGTLNLFEWHGYSLFLMTVVFGFSYRFVHYKYTPGRLSGQEMRRAKRALTRVDGYCSPVEELYRASANR